MYEYGKFLIKQDLGRTWVGLRPDFEFRCKGKHVFAKTFHLFKKK